MRTLLIAGLGTMMATAGIADAQRMVQRGPGASYPAPGRGGFGGGMVGQPGMGVPPGRPGMSYQPGRPGMGYQPNVPGGHGGQPSYQPGQPGMSYQPGRPGYQPGRPGAGYQPGVPGGYQPGRPGMGYQPGVPGGGYPVKPGYQQGRPGQGGSHWQNRGGRWVGGWNAPGGWNGYRRPYVGWALPSYWAQPGFVVGNWAGYGLAQPPYGYSWSRYYDDAVLIDARGSVYDTVGGIDWDGGAGYADGGYDDRGYDDGYGRDNGLGGAAIGAVAGGVAGNLIAGRGNRLGGTLIGAGVGGLTGYAIDKSEDRGRRAPPPPAYGAGYAAPGYAPGYGQGGGHWVSPNGTTTVTTSGGYYGGGSTTTVVVQSAPVVTTTTTEIVEDNVTYTRRAPSKVVKRRWRPTKTICRC